MKVNDSGMPDEAYWNTLFDIRAIVDWLQIRSEDRVVEVGCGYGTFTVPIAQRRPAKLYAFDIESGMVDITGQRLNEAELPGVQLAQRDLIAHGTGLPAGSVDLFLLFNILHFAERRVLLQEAARNLAAGGRVAIIHWRRDMPTPRGPAVHLRPELSDIEQASAGTGLDYRGNSRVLEPYHLGIQLIREV